MVGLMAGMLKRERAYLRADTWKPGQGTGQNEREKVGGDIRRAKTRATEADMREVGEKSRSLAFYTGVLTVPAKHTQTSDVTASSCFIRKHGQSRSARTAGAPGQGARAQAGLWYLRKGCPTEIQPCWLPPLQRSCR